MHFTPLLLVGTLAKSSLAAYAIKDDYSADNFFNMFNFDTVRLFAGERKAVYAY